MLCKKEISIMLKYGFTTISGLKTALNWSLINALYFGLEFYNVSSSGECKLISLDNKKWEIDPYCRKAEMNPNKGNEMNICMKIKDTDRGVLIVSNSRGKIPQVLVFISYCDNTDNTDKAVLNAKVFKEPISNKDYEYECNKLYHEAYANRDVHYIHLSDSNIMYYAADKDDYHNSKPKVKVSIEMWNITSFIRAMQEAELKKLNINQKGDTFTFEKDTKTYVSSDYEGDFQRNTIAEAFALPIAPMYMVEFTAERYVIKIVREIKPKFKKKGGKMEMLVEFPEKNTVKNIKKIPDAIQANRLLKDIDHEDMPEYHFTIIENSFFDNLDDMDHHVIYSRDKIAGSERESYYYYAIKRGNEYDIFNIDSYMVEEVIEKKRVPDYLLQAYRRICRCKIVSEDDKKVASISQNN